MSDGRPYKSSRFLARQLAIRPPRQRGSERCDDLHSLAECLREAAKSGVKSAVIDPLALLGDHSPKAVLVLLQELATKHAMAIVVVIDTANWERLPAHRTQLPRTLA